MSFSQTPFNSRSPSQSASQEPSPSPTSTPSQSPKASPGGPCSANTLCTSGVCAPNGVCCAAGTVPNNVHSCSNSSSPLGLVSGCSGGFSINAGRFACGLPAGLSCAANSDCFSSSCLSSYCCAAPIGNCYGCDGSGACTGCTPGSGLELNTDKSQCVLSAAVPTPSPSPSAKPGASNSDPLGIILGAVLGALSVFSTAAVGAFNNLKKARSFLCLFCRDRELDEARRRWPLAAALYDELLFPEPGLRVTRDGGGGKGFTAAGNAVIAFETTYRSHAGYTGEASAVVRVRSSLDTRPLPSDSWNVKAYADTAKERAQAARDLFALDTKSPTKKEYRFPPLILCGLCGRSRAALIALLS